MPFGRKTKNQDLANSKRDEIAKNNEAILHDESQQNGDTKNTDVHENQGTTDAHNNIKMQNADK